MSEGAGGLHGDVRVVEDPPSAYAELVRAELSTSPERPFRLAISGGSSGEACLRALLAAGLAWGEVAVFFADERCVPAGDARSNARSLAAVLGLRAGEVAGWYPMSCDEGPAAYQRLLGEGGPLDLVQLGFGPDGHTVLLFPGSAALDAPPGALVVTNTDPSGRNPLERMTLTLEAIGSARHVVIVVAGEEKHDALAALVSGGDLPAGRVRSEQLTWLIDARAAAGLPL